MFERRTLRVIQAILGMPKPVTETEVNDFLESKLNVQIASIDEEGYPMIQPAWFLYDKESGKIYIATSKMSKKFKNLRIFSEILTRFTFPLTTRTIHTRE